MITGTAGGSEVHVSGSSTLNVQNNRGNGSNGGDWYVDASTLNFEDNGSFGLSVATLDIKNESLLNCNGNYLNGIHVMSGFDSEDSTIVAMYNGENLGRPGALLLGDGAAAGSQTYNVTNTTMTLMNNEGPGLNLRRGTLVFDNSSKLTITDNRAFKPDYTQSGAGLYLNDGTTATIPATAVIYNNRSALGGDDIYVGPQATLTFGAAYPGVLNEKNEPWTGRGVFDEDPVQNPFPSENHLIDGWYLDGPEARWSAHAIAPATNNMTSFASGTVGPLYLKAAHRLYEVTGTKTWIGGDTQNRPDVIISLLADGQPAKDANGDPVPDVKLEFPNLGYTFGSLLKYNTDATEILYTVDEDKVANFDSVVQGMNVTNTYVAPPPPTKPTYPTLRVPIGAFKVLKNASLSAGQFTFELRDKAGTVLATAQNAADGSVVFPDRTFSREVTNYIYTIREIPGTDPKMTYDRTVYTVIVTTTAQTGGLKAQVSMEKDGIPYAGSATFTNVREVPKTGDSSPGMISTLAIASLLMGVAWMVTGKRQRPNSR